MMAVERELQRLRQRQQQNNSELATNDLEIDHPEWLALQAELDPFDQVQLAYVVQVCRGSSTLSEAGRRLFRRSRQEKKLSNDADRLRKYLAKFNLHFTQLQTW